MALAEKVMKQGIHKVLTITYVRYTSVSQCFLYMSHATPRIVVNSYSNSIF